jgi:hypothetical protein
MAVACLQCGHELAAKSRGLRARDGELVLLVLQLRLECRDLLPHLDRIPPRLEQFQGGTSSVTLEMDYLTDVIGMSYDSTHTVLPQAMHACMLLKTNLCRLQSV